MLHNMQVLKFSWIVVSVLLLSSCTETYFYEKSYSFPKNEWKQEVKPKFVIDIQDTSVAYDFILTFRNTTDYAYSNVWLFLNTKTPDNSKGREPFEIKITNPDGTWIGTKTGTVIENQLFFKRRKLPKKGKYTFTLEQGVTQTVLKEVLDISLLVQKVEK